MQTSVSHLTSSAAEARRASRDAILLDGRCLKGERERAAVRALVDGSTANVVFIATHKVLLDYSRRFAALGWRVTVVTADHELRIRIRNCLLQPLVMCVDARALVENAIRSAARQQEHRQ